jgi:hypothetical protein
MIIEMPFLHRLYAATSKSPEPREMAAWDMERLEIEDLSISDFEPGAELGDKKTFIAREHHWASLVGAVYPHHARYELAKDELSNVFTVLAHRIGCSRFFAVGSTKLPQTSILMATPKTQYIRSSQREVNVANLSAWVQENLVSVDGELFVRVREPAIYLDIIGPFNDEKCFMTIRAAALSPASVSEDHGILSTISDRYELLELAHNLLSSDARMMRVDSDFKGGAFDRIHSTSEDASDMAARTLVAQAKRMTSYSHRHYGPAKLFEALSKEFKKPEREFRQARLDHLADLLSEHVHEMRFPMSTMTEIALDRWNSRSITLDLGNAEARKATIISPAGV